MLSWRFCAVYIYGDSSLIREKRLKFFLMSPLFSTFYTEYKIFSSQCIESRSTVSVFLRAASISRAKAISIGGKKNISINVRNVEFHIH